MGLMNLSFQKLLNSSILYLKYFIDDYIMLIIYNQSPGLSPAKPEPGLSLDNGLGSSFVKLEPAKAKPKHELLSPAQPAHHYTVYGFKTHGDKISRGQPTGALPLLHHFLISANLICPAGQARLPQDLAGIALVLSLSALAHITGAHIMWTDNMFSVNLTHHKIMKEGYPWNTKPEPDQKRTLGLVQRFKVQTEVQDWTLATLSSGHISQHSNKWLLRLVCKYPTRAHTEDT